MITRSRGQEGGGVVGRTLADSCVASSGVLFAAAANVVAVPYAGEVPRTSHVTRHTSHVTRHTSHVTRHTSHVTRHTSHVTRHSSQPPVFPCVATLPPRLLFSKGKSVVIWGTGRGATRCCTSSVCHSTPTTCACQRRAAAAAAAAAADAAAAAAADALCMLPTEMFAAGWSDGTVHCSSHVTRHTSHVTRHTSLCHRLACTA